MAVPYHELHGLQTLYLEDSFVLSINEEPQRFSIDLHCVLTKDDPFYRPPEPDEQNCYEKLSIAFESIKSVDWAKKDFKWSADANGERDLGNIDTFVQLDSGAYELTGDWGIVRIVAGGVKVIRQ